MACQNEIRVRVTNTIIEALRARLCPWHMPWSPARNTGFPANVVTRRRYSGVNPLLLQLAALERGFQSRWWGSFDQWASLGGVVRARPDDVPPGHWGTTIVLRERLRRSGWDKNGERHVTHLHVLRQQVVFNADQVQGVSQFQVQVPKAEVQPDFGPAERIIQATGADIREVEADKAWYHYPPKDFIEIPSKVDFIIGKGGLKSWYDTVFHEICHWSEPRLGWHGGYDLNELRAEMGAGFLSSAIGIPSYGPTKHHFDFLASWIAAMRSDHRVIFRVAAAATAAAHFILACNGAERLEEAEAAVS